MKRVKVRGTALLSCERYLTERFGKAAWPRVLSGLDADDRERLEDVVDSERYRFSLLLKVGRRAQELFGAQEPRLHEEMGRASADHGVSGLYKVLFRMGSPKFIISQAPQVWNSHFNSGEMRAVLAEKDRAVVELADFAEPAPEVCERVMGWLARCVELAGGDKVQIVHTECVHRGGKVCRYEGSWS